MGLCYWRLLQFVTSPQIKVPVPVGELTGAFTLGEEGLEGLAGVQWIQEK